MCVVLDEIEAREVAVTEPRSFTEYGNGGVLVG